ncbi:hypothetical protein F503_04131 [Ophiostoma piceae UAMH 11346]|uniref:Uncharacterized protein n=1 Tax=Ophiostoma piceae (strain UAMH 11346) TaxID=1262450 RepID=S3C4W0_OPHP1|nr:hypothetical protein F503_04131 [Ophiostoma piceae UAMH 11346]
MCISLVYSSIVIPHHYCHCYDFAVRTPNKNLEVGEWAEEVPYNPKHLGRVTRVKPTMPSENLPCSSRLSTKPTLTTRNRAALPGLLTLQLDQATPLVQPIPLSDMTTWLEDAAMDGTRLWRRERQARCSRTFPYHVGNIYEHDDAARHVETSCMLAQNTVLTDDCLTVTVTELAAVYNLAVLRTQDGVLKTTKCIPLTIILFGAPKGCVVHGHVDPDSHAIYLAMSSVMDFRR